MNNTTTGAGPRLSHSAIECPYGSTWNYDDQKRTKKEARNKMRYSKSGNSHKKQSNVERPGRCNSTRLPSDIITGRSEYNDHSNNNNNDKSPVGTDNSCSLAQEKCVAEARKCDQGMYLDKPEPAPVLFGSGDSTATSNQDKIKEIACVPVLTHHFVERTWMSYIWELLQICIKATLRWLLINFWDANPDSIFMKDIFEWFFPRMLSDDNDLYMGIRRTLSWQALHPIRDEVAWQCGFRGVVPLQVYITIYHEHIRICAGRSMDSSANQTLLLRKWSERYACVYNELDSVILSNTMIAVVNHTTVWNARTRSATRAVAPVYSTFQGA